MISRLTAAAAVFAILAAASLTFAADLPHDVPVTRAAATQAPVVHLERVVITAKHLPS
jgi:Flp pilus assembly protein CpaB